MQISSALVLKFVTDRKWDPYDRKSLPILRVIGEPELRMRCNSEVILSDVAVVMIVYSSTSECCYVAG